jgi:hypothetical protein
MPRPRTPLSQAEATGAVDKNPQRYRDRKAAPKYGGELGPAPMHFTPEQVELWQAIVDRIPAGVLVAADCYIVELTVVLLGRFRDPQYHMRSAEVAELRRCLGSMGLTPADRTRVTGSDADDESDDPIGLLFGALN